MTDAAATTNGSAVMETEKVILMSKDQKKFEVSRAVAKMSGLVADMIEEYEDETPEAPLMNVTGKVLKKVLEFCEQHVAAPMEEIKKPLRTNDMSQVVSEWDANFVEIPQEELFELILAANFLDIKSLLDLTCAKVASMIKGKTPEEIRKTFNIVNDFTPEEEKQVREENKWCEEA